MRPELLFFAVGLAYCYGSAIMVSQTTDTVYLAPGTSIDIAENVYGSKTLRTYCYPGEKNSVLGLFETVEFVLNIANEEYTEYGGKSPEEVLEHYNEQKSLFSLTLFSQKRKKIPLSPFEQQCIGVASRQPYKVTLYYRQVDLMRLLQLSAGILIFWSSRRLAKNAVFYYLAGGSMGIFASILIIIFLASKLFPRRPMMYGVLIGGWTIGFYVIKQLVDNMRVILLTYRDYVVWYLVITGLISFLICYRFGPPKNPRSQNIVMWVLQALGGALMYFSSWHTRVTIFVMVVTFVAHYFPPSLVAYCKKVYRLRFPPKMRFLTQEEYYLQTANETAKSLSELRQFVNSPECKQWSVIANLRNPMRFASFANGAPHLFDEEIDDYSRAIEESMEQVAEEEAEEYVQCSMYYRPPAERHSSENRERDRASAQMPTHSRHFMAQGNDDSSSDEEEDNNEYMDQDEEDSD
uniref:CG9723-PA n=1 Tax=Drosophila ananassae TaxID=7217 RepID=D1GYY5_DROAN|nr:CG9723-PA [Drosophila ananassae]